MKLKTLYNYLVGTQFLENFIRSIRIATFKDVDLERNLDPKNERHC